MAEIRLGSINGSHGVKGWVRVFSHTDPVKAILDYSPWILRRGEEVKEVTVSDGRPSGKRLIARLVGVESREAADALAGYEIHVPQEALPEPEQGDYYWFQLQGFTVRNREGTVFGRIDYMLETGANDVMVVQPTESSVDSQERLIPYVAESVVVEVNQRVGEVVVDWQVGY